jgi:kynurenine 3-monooxygenase
VNVIARPNHDVWKINDPDELREWFQKAFPRMNFSKENGVLPKEEWERFINEDGTRFPHCQYTNGVALNSIDKKSAVVLVGDALHSCRFLSFVFVC